MSGTGNCSDKRKREEIEQERAMSGEQQKQKKAHSQCYQGNLIEQALKDALAPLNADDNAFVASASNRKVMSVMHENSGAQITKAIWRCLLPCEPLNDKIINLYLELLKEREKRETDKFLKCHFFSTFFYKKLYNPNTRYDYEAVRRWTTQKKIGYNLTDCDKIFVPIHKDKELHWCLAIIDMKAEKFQYLDSRGKSDASYANVLDVLAAYIIDEAKDKTGQDLDTSSWEKQLVDDLPQQENRWDCGMFMIKYVDFYSRGLPLRFCQTHMRHFRKRTIKEILNLKAE